MKMTQEGIRGFTMPVGFVESITSPNAQPEGLLASLKHEGTSEIQNALSQIDGFLIYKGVRTGFTDIIFDVEDLRL